MIQDFMQSQSSAFDELYDSLVKNRTAQAKSLGYSNFVPLGYDRMQRNCYGRKQVRAFRKSIQKYWVPFATRLQEKRCARLGVEHLTLADQGVYFKEGNPTPGKTPEEILEKGLEMYEKLSPETGEFMKTMVGREMFDVLGRPGKRQGGYMEFLPELRMPLVFANFNGTSADVDVMTHECGHAFQGYLAGKDDVREHWDITMETAETHSMSMEFFTNPWMELFFGEDAARFCQMQLEDAICFIPYGCMVDEFQEIMYEYPELTPSQRHEVWKRLEGKYRPHLDQTGMKFFEKGGLWQRQHHIYSSPFYYIDYCIAQLCALQYKMLMTKDYQKAWESYLKLCRMSAGEFFTDMICEVGLENPFDEKTIEKLVTQLGEYIPLMEEE
jgi:M3 family oligoendopeptidase